MSKEDEILEQLKAIERAIQKLTSEMQVHLKAVAEAVLENRL
jgi:DNA-binding FrmR family transcriptional regulator